MSVAARGHRCTETTNPRCHPTTPAAVPNAMQRRRACVRFRFLQRPEYVTPGSRFVFREGRTKGVGVVMAAERDALPGSGGGCGVGSGGGGSGGGANEGVRREGATVR